VRRATRRAAFAAPVACAAGPGDRAPSAPHGAHGAVRSEAAHMSRVTYDARP